MRRFSQISSRVLPAIFFSVLLSACGGGGSSTATATSSAGVSDPVKAPYTIGGTLSGLSSNASLTLLNDGSDTTSVGANGSFTFSSAIAAGGSYNVTVGRQPVGHLCTVSNGTGSNLSAQVTNVAVNCVASSVNVLASLHTGYGYGSYGLMQADDGNFYGTALGGGEHKSGSIYRVTPAGELLRFFSFRSSTDGNGPSAGLVRGADGELYGTTTSGGTSGKGTAFKISTSGTFTLLHNFVGNEASDGAYPNGSLLLASDGNFYGTTPYGGSPAPSAGAGTVFKMTPNGVLTVIKRFTGGENPYAGLVEASDGFLYGTFAPDSADAGGVFRISLDGAYSLVHSFDMANEGADSYRPLIQATDGNLYGTLSTGGAGGYGAVFRMNLDGKVTVLHAFAGGTADGAAPDFAGVLQANDGNLYGVTRFGGSFGGGVLYRLTLTGDFAVLHSFGSGTDGREPAVTLIQGTDGKLYGTTLSGGGYGGGTVFVY